MGQKYTILAVIYSAVIYTFFYSNNYYIEVTRDFLAVNLMNIYKLTTYKIYSNPSSNNNNNAKVYTPNELKQYSNLEKGLYLALLGKVYDVTSGAKYYGPDGSYHGFVGRDASLAFITGDFSEEGLSDDISNLTNPQVLSLYEWISFYDKNYIYKGKLFGKYYDMQGNPTPEFDKVLEKVKLAQESKLNDERKNTIFPPCNIEWNVKSGTRVWCTKNSGGIARDWVGVPRMLFDSPQSKQKRCACVRLSTKAYQENQGNFKEYEGCKTDSTSCFVK